MPEQLEYRRSRDFLMFTVAYAVVAAIVLFARPVPFSAGADHRIAEARAVPADVGTQDASLRAR